MSIKKPKPVDFEINEKVSITSVMKNVTALHGTNHFSRLRGKQKMLWMFLILVNAVSTITFLVVIKQRYNEDHIVTKIYSDCPLDLVPFPAVSICNFNLVSLKNIQGFVRILRNHGVAQKDIERFFRELPLLRADWFYLQVANHTNIMTILKEHYFTIQNIMEEIHQSCEDLLVYCEFNRKQKDCQQMFGMTKTFDGFCCTFNYIGVEEELVDNVFVEQEEDAEYYYDISEGTRTKTTLLATTQFGRSSGLRVVVDVEPMDYPSWALTPYHGASVILSDPNDFPETSAKYRFLSMGNSLDIKVDPMLYKSDNNLRSVEPARRNCWFHDEASLENTDRYSFETCATECRMRSYLKGCGCVPYKYPADKDVRVCELEDVPCLHDMKVHWETKMKQCVPTCNKECSDKAYYLSSDTMPFLQHWFPEKALAGRNASHLSGLQVYFNKPTCTCYRLSLMMDLNYFVATYGGVFSLSFGASIITIVEIAYLLVSFIFKTTYRLVSDRLYRNPNRIQFVQ